MKHAPQKVNHHPHYRGNGFTCAFNGENGKGKGARKEAVRRLFRDSVNEIMKDKGKLRDFVGDIEDGCPHVCKSISQNNVTLTAYAYNNGELGMRLDCNENGCERNHVNACFRLNACMDEPILLLPLKLQGAAIKEQRAMKREDRR